MLDPSVLEDYYQSCYYYYYGTLGHRIFFICRTFSLALALTRRKTIFVLLQVTCQVLHVSLLFLSKQWLDLFLMFLEPVCIFTFWMAQSIGSCSVHDCFKVIQHFLNGIRHCAVVSPECIDNLGIVILLPSVLMKLWYILFISNLV